MAEFSSFRVYGLRVVLVAFGVFALFGLKSLSRPDDIRLSKLEEVIAGTDAELSLQAEPNSSLILEWTGPDGLLNSVPIEVDEDGQIHYRFDPKDLEQSGSYELSAYYKRHSSSALKSSFEVLPAEPDLSHSKVSFSSSVLKPNQDIQMSVQLMDAFENPVTGHRLSVEPSSEAVEVFSSEFVTDEEGQMNFTLMGAGDGRVNLSFFDLTLGQNILAPTSIALVGGAAIEEDVRLAESGPVDSFLITGLDNETESGLEQSVTVKAIDEEGFTVLDYTGTIRFSSSDSQASLPNDYTFLAEDQGEHTFSLGVKFVTLGEQTLTVVDLDDIQVNGEEDTTVVPDEDASTSYDNDFETTDFEREGDFSLSSPATGSYSESSVQVQGEAEYGYTAVVFLNGEEAGETDIEYDNSFSYSLEDLSDGVYTVFVEIQEDDGSLIESSDSEVVTIDTTPPSLVSITVDPKTNIQTGSSVVVTVLSEADLEDSTLIFQEEVNALEETATPGKYQATLVMPETEGDYSLDVFLSDSLGNEVEYRDELTLTVSDEESTDSPETPNTSDTSNSSESQIGKVVGLIATGNEEKVALSWESPESALSIAYYRVYYGPSSESLFAVSETTDASSNWTIPDLEGGQSYYFAVTAVDIEGKEGPLSQAVLGTPKASTGSTISTPPPYPVSTNIMDTVKENPETGPATNALFILSSLGSMAYVLLRKRARARPF